MNGLDVQAQLSRMRSDLSVIIVTAKANVQTAVRAMKAGANDFLEKPYKRSRPCLGPSRPRLSGNIA